MKPNADCTVFNRIYDPVNRKYNWQAKTINGVFWQGGTGAKVGKSGMREDNETIIFIPFSSVEQLTLLPEDKIIRGISNATSPDGLKGVLTVMAVDTFDFGSPDMQHWEVVAK
ncbi:DUF6751 family protein [Anaerotignum sp. MB30-C6]|uniref:DUF6751 family protein n=1 Tax=Anaerotignum sp. MB30-C6 TaxID=3070814 RepID=UPI0027DC7CAC|nr:DUF6751 family protein [Anaerotignum sp. MB30-C6]WMI81842.1 hypothetical protein RBQ60_03695 [Anaerotignum sp. MB30-C6]